MARCREVEQQPDVPVRSTHPLGGGANRRMLRRVTTPRGPRGRNQSGREARRRILQAAFEIASERGYDGTTLALVTARAGLRPGSVYWQFDSKDTILAEVLEVSYEQWRADMDSAAAAWERTAPDAAALESHDPGQRAAAATARLRHMLAEGLLAKPQFWTLGLMLAFERHLTETTARQRFRQIRAVTVSQLEQRFTAALPDRVAAADPGLARTLAQLTMIWSDGLLICSQTDEPFDMDGALVLLAAGLEAVMTEAVGPAAAGPA